MPPATNMHCRHWRHGATRWARSLSLVVVAGAAAAATARAEPAPAPPVAPPAPAPAPEAPQLPDTDDVPDVEPVDLREQVRNLEIQLAQTQRSMMEQRPSVTIGAYIDFGAFAAQGDGSGVLLDTG